MSSQISSLFLSVPSTARLEIPEELQRAHDFESTRNEAISEEEETTEPGLEMDCLLGYELLRDRKKLRSLIWQYGWRLLNAEGHEHWICRNCHTSPPKPKKPKGHLFKTTAQTSGPIYRLTSSRLFFRSLLASLLPKSPFAPPLCLLHILPFLSLRSLVSILCISAYYHTLVSLWLLTRVAS